jgi:hypothetical protein
MSVNLYFSFLDGLIAVVFVVTFAASIYFAVAAAREIQSYQ